MGWPYARRSAPLLTDPTTTMPTARPDWSKMGEPDIPGSVGSISRRRPHTLISWFTQLDLSKDRTRPMPSSAAPIESVRQSVNYEYASSSSGKT